MDDPGVLVLFLSVSLLYIYADTANSNVSSLRSAPSSISSTDINQPSDPTFYYKINDNSHRHRSTLSTSPVTVNEVDEDDPDDDEVEAPYLCNSYSLRFNNDNNQNNMSQPWSLIEPLSEDIIIVLSDLTISSIIATSSSQEAIHKQLITELEYALTYTYCDIYQSVQGTWTFLYEESKGNKPSSYKQRRESPSFRHCPKTYKYMWGSMRGHRDIYGNSSKSFPSMCFTTSYSPPSSSSSIEVTHHHSHTHSDSHRDFLNQHFNRDHSTDGTTTTTTPTSSSSHRTTTRRLSSTDSLPNGENSCKFLPIRQLLRIVGEYLEDRSIVFIGDSVMGQLYNAAQCMVERETWFDALPFDMIWDPMILPSKDVRCINAVSKAKLIAAGGLPASLIKGSGDSNNTTIDSLPFVQCHDQGHQHILNVSWYEIITPKDTGVLILNAGAWYDAIVYEHEKTYRHMLLAIKEIIQEYLQHNVIVIWLENVEINPTMIRLNTIAKEELHSLTTDKGIVNGRKLILLNHHQATLMRLKQDREFMKDIYHYYNPSKTGQSRFFNHILLHGIVIEILKNMLIDRNNNEINIDGNNLDYDHIHRRVHRTDIV